MILGLRFSPEGPLPWFNDVEGTRRRLGEEATKVKPKKSKRRKYGAKQNLSVIGIAPSGHKIHEIQLIAFHKTGLGVNVVLVNAEGIPYGWRDLQKSVD